MNLVFTSKDYLHNFPGEFDVVRCAGCGLVYTNPRPEKENIGKYYPTDYAPYNFSTGGDSAARRSFFLELKAFLKKLLVSDDQTYVPPLRQGAKILEIGCANGWFLKGLKDRGYATKGIEMSAEASAYAKKVLGLDVTCGSIMDIELGEDKYDCIFSWMVLEHLHDPSAIIKKIRRALKDGGVFVFSVPNVNSLEARLFGKYWYNIDVPRHLYHFSVTSISAILERNGFSVKQFEYIGNFTSFALSLGYLLEDRFGASSVTRWLRKFGGTKTSTGMSLMTLFLGYPYIVITKFFRNTGRIIVIVKPK